MSAGAFPSRVRVQRPTYHGPRVRGGARLRGGHDGEWRNAVVASRVDHCNFRDAADDPNAVDPLGPDGSTVFRFVLDAVDQGTPLTVVKSGCGGLSDAAASTESKRAE